MTKYAWCYGEISMCIVYTLKYNNSYYRTYKSNIKMYKSINISGLYNIKDNQMLIKMQEMGYNVTEYKL